MNIFGNVEHKIDSKGRVMVPPRYREQFQEEYPEDNNYVLMNGFFKGFLFFFHSSIFQRIINRLHSTSSFFDTTGSSLEMLLSGNSSPVCFDKAGRILIPQQMQDYAGITKVVIIVARRDGLSFWGREEWERFCKNPKSYPKSEIAEIYNDIFNKYGI